MNRNVNIKQNNNATIDGYCELLQVTPSRKYVLKIQGKKGYAKRLTAKEARAWLAKHYPERSWKGVFIQIDEWFKFQKKAA